MKKGNGKAIILSISALAIVGGLYYFLIYKKDKGVKGKIAYFKVNGFVYSVGTKAQAYPKVNDEIGGIIQGVYKEDKDFWVAKNTKGQEVLLKKSDVTLE